MNHEILPSHTDREKQILSEQEFFSYASDDNSGEKVPVFRNFWAAFAGGPIRGAFRNNSEWYIRFSEEYPDLSEELCHNIQLAEDEDGEILDRLETCKGDLYRAYSILRNYGYSNEDLFR